MSIDEYKFHDEATTLWGWPKQNPVRHRDPTGRGPITDAILCALFPALCGPSLTGCNARRPPNEVCNLAGMKITSSWNIVTVSCSYTCPSGHRIEESWMYMADDPLQQAQYVQKQLEGCAPTALRTAGAN